MKTHTEVLAVAKNVRALVLDGDGVFFTGRVLVHPKDGEMLKERSHIDGQGISLLRAVGVVVAMVSGESTGFLEVVGGKLNDLPSVKEGRWAPIRIITGPQKEGKVAAVTSWLQENGIDWNECAVMGDDLSDLHMIRKAGLKTAPRQAEDVIKKEVDWVAARNGGDGAIRDLANLILDAKGIDPTVLSLR